MKTGAGPTVADVWTISIAGAAFGLSLVSLIWQVIRSRYERPVLGIIVGGLRLGSEVRPTGWRVTITITNVGERPVTVMAAWATVILEDRAEVFQPDASEVASMPYRLEAYDSLTIRMSRPGSTMAWTDGLELTAHAQIVVRPTLWARLRRKGTVRVRRSRVAKFIGAKQIR